MENKCIRRLDRIKKWFKQFNSILNEINLLGYGPKD